MAKTREASRFITPVGMSLEVAERVAKMTLFALGNEQWFMNVIVRDEHVVVVFTHSWAYSEETVEKVSSLLSEQSFVLTNRNPVSSDGCGSWV